MTEWLIFDNARRLAARGLNDKERAIEPRLIDNPAALLNYGKYALHASILTAPGYERFANTIKNHPRLTAEAADLFLPTVE